MYGNFHYINLLIFHPLQDIFIHNSRLVVDEDNNGKFRLERVNVESTSVRVVPLNPPSHIHTAVRSQKVVSAYLIILGIHMDARNK